MATRILLFSITLFFFASFCNAQVLPKRSPQKEVTPVIIDSIKYTAQANEMGFIIAKDVNTDSVLWRKQIYSIRYNNSLEKDVQSIFIDSLYFNGKHLIIHTERNKVYYLKVK